MCGAAFLSFFAAPQGRQVRRRDRPAQGQRRLLDRLRLHLPVLQERLHELEPQLVQLQVHMHVYIYRVYLRIRPPVYLVVFGLYMTQLTPCFLSVVRRNNPYECSSVPQGFVAV